MHPPASGPKYAVVRFRLVALLLVFSLLALAIPTRFIPIIQTAEAASSNIVISQVYGGAGCGTVGCSTYKNDYIELFNRGTSPQSLSGWSVQYAAATGTSWQVTNLTNVTLQPGQYYLVQEGTGANGVSNIPTPDATGAILMSATTGKVALVSATAALSGACPTTGIIDFVGYGGANCNEGGTNAPAPSTTTADLRAGNGCTDTDVNGTDFTAAAPTPRNTSTPAATCGVTNQSLQFSSATYSINENGGSATITVTRTNGSSGTVSVNYATGGGSATAGADYTATSGTLTFNAGETSKTFSVPVIDDSTYEGNETVNLTLSSPSAGATLGSQSSAALTIVENDPVPNQAITTNCPTPLSTVQGTAASTNVSATDPDGRVTAASITGGGAAGITLDNFVPAAASGGTATATLSVANTVAAGTYNVDIQYSNDDSPTPQTATCTVVVNVQSPPTPAGALVISQLYGGGGNSGATLKYDYIEIFNRSSNTVTLNGWSVQYTSQAGPSGGGNWSGKTNLTGTIAPGQYILVQEATNNVNNGADLPVTPDIPGGTINMSATDGKVALVHSTNFLVGTCPNTDPNLIDLVGYGGANCYEGVAAAPSPSATNAIFRARDGCKDTDYNAVNFTTGGPAPRNSSSPTNVCPAGDEAPEVFSTTPTNGATNVSLTSNITINFDQNVNVTGSWFQISCSTSNTHTATATAASAASFTLNPDTDFVGDEQCTVTVFASGVTDQDSADPPDNMAADKVFSFHTLIPRDPAEHLVMGNPSGAATTDNNNYLLLKDQYVHSYNCQRGTPNWVSWHLDQSWLGSAPRQDDFRFDPATPAGCYQVQGTDYSGSGFDRGHMTPSADRTSSIPDNSATFFMTNMVPQAPDNNQGPWADMENDLRTMLSNGANELYIVSGGAGTGGVGSGGARTTITNGNVTVPEKTWKVVMVLPTGSGNDAARVDNSTRTFAVIMPNVQGIRNDDWRKYLATVDQVEALTGYDFFSNVPADIQAVIEARLDDTLDTTPVANGQSVTTAEDTQKTVTLTASDFNVNNVFTYTVVDQPQHGTLSTVTGDQVTYTPAADYNGPDSFTFKVNDGARDSNTATVSINVTPVNDPPVANDDAFSTSEDASAADVNVLGNDTDVENDTLTVTAVGAAAHGTATLVSGVVKYAPAANYNGSDSFTYTISDGHSGTATGTVNVNVSGVNDNPTATNDTATTDEDTAVSVDVVFNDNDIDGDTLSLESVDGATHGSVAVASGQAVFTPDANYNGPASFSYVVSDGNGGTATGSVSVTVNAVNDNPVAVADEATTNEDSPVTVNVLSNDSDVDGDSLSVTNAGGATKGSVTFTAGDVTYTPNPNANGTDSFTYTVSDGNGGSATAAVSVTINAVNDAPTLAGVPSSATIAELATYTFTASAADVDGDGLTFSLVGAPAGASINPSTGEFSWTPTEAQGGTGAPFNFTVSVSDGTSNTDSAVSITVTEVNQAPTLTPIGNQTVLLGGTLTFNASATDADLPAQTLTYSLTGAFPAGASINPTTGVFNWTPTAAQAGQTYTFGVRVTDNGAGLLYDEEIITVGAGYTWSGFLQPINQDGSSVFKLGQTIPVKFQLTGASAGITDAVARLYVKKVSDTVQGTEETEAVSTSNATEGNLFRYADGQYIFNLSTKGLTVGTYQLRVDTGDGVLRVVNISLR